VLDSALSSRRFHVGIDDGRLYGSTELRLPAGTDVLPAVSKAAGRNFNSLDEYRHWEKGLTAAEVQAFYERFVVERFPQLKPEDVSYLDDYREIAPGFWFPAVQGYLLASGDIGRAIRLVESKVDQPLADSLFVIDLKDGIEVTDCSYDPPLFYKQKADRTPEEWQGILGKHKRQADEWKAEIAARDAWIGRPAPELPKSAWVNSEPLSLASLKGRVVLLDFWATDCGGCRSELLAAESMYRDAKDNGIIVIGVHASGTGRDEVEAFAKQMKLTYPIAIDGPPPEGVIVFGELSGRLGVRSIPYSFVIDQQGKVVAHGGNVGKALESAYALVRKPRE
jgi:thiol-disulfide isomerase/thioredoxin